MLTRRFLRHFEDALFTAASRLGWLMMDEARKAPVDDKGTRSGLEVGKISLTSLIHCCLVALEPSFVAVSLGSSQACTSPIVS
jgi:hypothetical protein